MCSVASMAVEHRGLQTMCHTPRVHGSKPAPLPLWDFRDISQGGAYAEIYATGVLILALHGCTKWYQWYTHYPHSWPRMACKTFRDFHRASYTPGRKAYSMALLRTSQYATNHLPRPKRQGSNHYAHWNMPDKQGCPRSNAAALATPHRHTHGSCR